MACDDVLIIGGGFVGMLMAIALAEKGFTSSLIEPNHQFDFPKLDNHTRFSSRTLAINPASEQILTSLGIWQDINHDRLGVVQKMHVWDKHFSGHIDFQALDYGVPHLNVIIEQENLLCALSKRLKAFPAIKTIHDTVITISPQPDTIGLEMASGVNHEAKVVVAADGANSWVRQELKLQSHSYPYEQQAVVATLQTEQSHLSVAYQCFSSEGPLALLPLGDPHLVSLVWSLDNNIAAQISQLKKAELEERITQQSEQVLGKLSLLTDVKAIPLHGSHAKTYYQSRCVLVGDSAHRIHPLAGLGANLGFMDVHALVEVFLRAHKKGRDIGHDSTLVRYQQKRWLQNQMVLRTMNAFRHVFADPRPAVRQCRAHGLEWVNSMPLLKRFFVQQAFGQGY